jgi:hypothetical protein
VNNLLKALYWFTEDCIMIFLWNKSLSSGFPERRLNGLFSGFSYCKSILCNKKER